MLKSKNINYNYVLIFFLKAVLKLMRYLYICIYTSKITKILYKIKWYLQFKKLDMEFLLTRKVYKFGDYRFLV